MAGRWVSTALGLVCTICSPATILYAAKAETALVAPSLSDQIVFGDAVLLQPLSRAQSRSLRAACATLETILPTEEEAEELGETCARTSGALFVQVRGDGEAFSSVRFKLNTAVGRQQDDLAELGRVASDFHAAIDWPSPGTFLAAVAAGTEGRCSFGTLLYEFFRESGDVPRFNLIVRETPIRFEPVQNFASIDPVCVVR